MRTQPRSETDRAGNAKKHEDQGRQVQPVSQIIQSEVLARVRQKVDPRNNSGLNQSNEAFQAMRTKQKTGPEKAGRG